jgi:hypothetical protein
MKKRNPWWVYSALFVACVAAAAETGSAPPEGTSTASEEPGHRLHYQARITYQTSRATGHDFRSFRSSATDESGATTVNSSLPDLNYLSARLSVNPWRKHTLSLGALQSLDPAHARTVSGPNGHGFALPGSIFMGHYGYKLSRSFSIGAGQTYVAGRRFSDPKLSLSYRNSPVDEGWGTHLGLGLSVPTSERSRNDQLITQATLRGALSFTAGRWTTSCGLAYSRPIYMHPGDLPAVSERFAERMNGSGGPTPSPDGGGGHHHHDHSASGSAGGTAYPAINDPNLTNLETVDFVLAERVSDRTTGSAGVSFVASPHWRFSSGAGVTYLETWKQKAVWLTNARVLSAAFSFWKMEAGTDFQLYSDIHKYEHPSLPSLAGVGFHLTYFLGDRRPSF